MSIYPRISKVGKSYILRRYVNGKRLHFYSRDLNELIEYDKLLEKGIIPVKRVGIDVKESELTNFINDGNIWKWIKGYEGLYAISDSGLIKSFWKDSRGQFVKTNNKNGWYLSFRATDRNKEVKTIRVHIAVAKAFIGQIPNGYEVHHRDGNKQNNCVSNLQILSGIEHKRLTLMENHHILDGMIAYNQGRAIHGKSKKEKRNVQRFKKGKIIQYSLNGEFINSYRNAMEASRNTGVCGRNILQVANKEPYNSKGSVRKQAGGYVWKFEKESEVM